MTSCLYGSGLGDRGPEVSGSGLLLHETAVICGDGVSPVQYFSSLSSSLIFAKDYATPFAVVVGVPLGTPDC